VEDVLGSWGSAAGKKGGGLFLFHRAGEGEEKQKERNDGACRRASLKGEKKEILYYDSSGGGAGGGEWRRDSKRYRDYSAKGREDFFPSAERRSNGGRGKSPSYLFPSWEGEGEKGELRIYSYYVQSKGVKK